MYYYYCYYYYYSDKTAIGGGKGAWYSKERERIKPKPMERYEKIRIIAFMKCMSPGHLLSNMEGN